MTSFCGEPGNDPTPTSSLINRRLSCMFLLSPLSCLRTSAYRTISRSTLSFLSAFLWVKGHPLPLSHKLSGCVWRACVCECKCRAYLMPLWGLWLKERQAWVESQGACPGCTTFIPEATHTILIMFNMLVIGGWVCGWITAPLSKGTANFLQWRVINKSKFSCMF